MSSPSASPPAGTPTDVCSNNVAALKQLRIQCGVVRRLSKEVSMYQMEAADLLVDFQQMKTAAIAAGSSVTADDERAHRLRKQQEVLRESQMMVPDTQRRLVAARCKMAELLLQHEATCSGEAEFLEATAEMAQEATAKHSPPASPPAAVTDSNNVAALKQLRIQSGVVRRLSKEVDMYQTESAVLLADLEQMKTAAIAAGSSMTADDERAHRLRKQQEVLRESQMMVPDTQRRLVAARDRMTELLRQHEAACSREAEFLEATAEMAQQLTELKLRQGDGPVVAI